jgi:hypothetical protein
LTPKYFTNFIKDEVFSSFLSFAILPLELRMIEGKSSEELVLPEETESSSSKPTEFFFQQNNIIKDPLNIILIENNKKAISNNSGFYIFLNLLKNNNIGQKKFTLVSLDSDHYLATSHNIDLNLLDSEVENDDSKSIPKKVVLLHLSKKEIVNNSNFAIIKSIVTFTSFKENKTKLQIFVYSGILDDFLRINNEQLLNSVEISIKILGLSGTSEEVFPEHDPDSNIYLFSNLDEIKFGILEIPIHNLGTKKFIKFNNLDESADFELIVRNNGQEISFKLRIIENTTSIINVLILGNRK